MRPLLFSEKIRRLRPTFCSVTLLEVASGAHLNFPDYQAHGIHGLQQTTHLSFLTGFQTTYNNPLMMLLIFLNPIFRSELI